MDILMTTHKTLFARNVIILAKSVKIIQLVLSATQISIDNSTPQPNCVLVCRAFMMMAQKIPIVKNVIILV
jgi:hypothetical protein